ncbi:hypothetical protein V8E54_004325 [Elaphomyces granulatus]
MVFNYRINTDKYKALATMSCPAHAFDYTTCDRHYASDRALQGTLDSEEALQQHLRDYAPLSVCETCDRACGSEEALKQHLWDSPVHAPSFDCDDCDRSFNSEEALQQHLRDSPAHAPSFVCETCDRAFGSEEALEQHLQDSPAHAPYCETCDRPFGSEEALEQHLRDSPLHAPRSFKCETCDRYFGNEEALKQHLRDSQIHQQDSETLCRAIGVEPLPQTCEQCEEAVRRTHVNIVDLIEWERRRGNTEERVQTFRSVADLRVYTKNTRKISQHARWQCCLETFTSQDLSVVCIVIDMSVAVGAKRCEVNNFFASCTLHRWHGIQRIERHQVVSRRMAIGSIIRACWRWSGVLPWVQESTSSHDPAQSTIHSPPFPSPYST